MVDHDYPKAKRVMDSLVQVLWTVHIRETCRQDAGEGVSALTPPIFRYRYVNWDSLLDGQSLRKIVQCCADKAEVR